jgi:Cu+-exporting ATPase
MRSEQSIEVAEPGAAQKSAPGTTRFAITGMTCGNCARHVTEAIQSVPGVRSATVSLEGQAAVVRWEAGAERSERAVVQAVEGAGFGAQTAAPQTEEGCGCDHKLAGWRMTLWIGVLGTAPLMIGEWGFGAAMRPWFQWVSFALAGVVQVFAGARFYRGAWSQLKVGGSNMDTLVSLGSTTAFGYSTWALLSGAGGHVYFMEAAAIITLISVGHWIESRVSARAAYALRRLLHLAPELARRRNADGSETQVPVAELQAGDLVALRPGERVPTDGEATDGDSAVDESMLTGESAPVDKRVGGKLYAGTLNLDGRLVMRVTATGEETALAHIIAAVQQAQSSRARIQRLADRVSNVFVPIVVAVAVGAGLWWGLAFGQAEHVHQMLAAYLWAVHPIPPGAAAFIVAAGVLIVACPCAMGLATPAAIMAGANAAARHGILIRDGMAMERAGEISTVLFDKTGTLTAGKPELVESWVGEPAKLPSQPISIPRLAASLAAHSSHPVSQALAKLSADRTALGNWQEIRGCGVQGQAEPGRETLRLGSLRWLETAKVDLTPGRQFIESWASQGATVVGLAAEGALLGLFAVKDTLKPGAREVVEQLQRQGLEVCLVTGDNARTAASIAAAANVNPARVFSEVRPEAKAELVKRLQQEGKRVAFVGDGINDAPAMEQADLGIAVSQASDIAREAADIILLKSEIEAVPESLALARATLRTIKQNLFWAFFYNAIGIPLAALGFLSPVLCAAAMGLSDLVVIGNALRLGRRSMSRPAAADSRR